MSILPDIQTNLTAPVSCGQVLDVLVLRWPEEPVDTMSPALLDHLCHCRECLRKWIALEAATELSKLPAAPPIASSSRERISLTPKV